MFQRSDKLPGRDDGTVRPLPPRERLRADDPAFPGHQRLQVHPELPFRKGFFKAADNLLLEEAFPHHRFIEPGNRFPRIVADRAQGGVGPVAHDGNRNGSVLHLVHAEVHAAGIESAAELFPQFPRRVRQRFLPEIVLRQEHRELVPAEPAAQAVPRRGNPFHHLGVPDNEFVPPPGAEQRIDQAEVHDIAGDHHPRLVRILHHRFPGQFGKRAGVQHLGQRVVQRVVPGCTLVFILRGPVVGGAVLRAFRLDAHQFHHRVVSPAVRQLQAHRVRLHVVDLVVKGFRFLLVASGPAGQRAGAVDAFLVSLPDPVAAFLPADRAVLGEFQDAAFDRIDHPGHIVHAGNAVQQVFHLRSGIFRRPHAGLVVMRPFPAAVSQGADPRLGALDLVHLLVRFGEKVPQVAVLADHVVHVADRIPGRRRRSAHPHRRAALHEIVHFFGEFRFARVRVDHQEFVPAEAVAVFLAEGPGQQFPGLAEDAVALFMPAGIVDHLEIVQVHQHDGHFMAGIGIIVAPQGHPVPDPRQPVRPGHFLQQLVFLIQPDLQVVVCAGQVPEFARAFLPDRPVLPDPLHRLQHRVDPEPDREPDHENDHEDLQHDHQAHEVHHLPHIGDGCVFGVERQRLQRVEAFPHVRADPVLHFVVFVVQHHFRGALHLFFRGKGGVVRAQLHGCHFVPKVRISFGVAHQAHRVVFPVHQLPGFTQGRLELLERRPAPGGGGHRPDGFLTPPGSERFLKVFVHEAPVPGHGKALHALRQEIRGLHQLMRRLVQGDLVFTRVRHPADASGQPES